MIIVNSSSSTLKSLPAYLEYNKTALYERRKPFSTKFLFFLAFSHKKIFNFIGIYTARLKPLDRRNVAGTGKERIMSVGRIVKEAEYIIENNATVRETAAFVGIGKSTVHKDVTEKLERIDADLFKKVRGVLDKNLKERHIRGGLATKKHYAMLEKKVKLS